ncbi:LuxR family maltose regulon positive regulatory protein [Streptomyces canus]|uniref:LuxR family maltose regulon positive regulatory protein n=1 Tax=Streptomyces canus TaxID=58343 RepID=A0AAW8FVT8_9ACTN|nr:LuxR family maltose regulon positive regulatory protein [Streptomyces canus]
MPHAPGGFSREGAAGALTPNGAPVLAARFTVPAVPKTFVRRPRVTECLTRALEGPLALVNGPAGAGKTLLVADWVATLTKPVAWLTVESGDNAPGVFWAYVLAALRHHGITLPDDIGTPARPREVDDSLLSRLAAHLNERTEPAILILDEFERVSAPEVAEGLEFVLRHAGAGLRLVLISRTEPLLPLHRYRAAGEMTDIRDADLAFLPDETAEVASRHGLPLSDEGARTLTERTGGWAAGLRLCILAAQRAEDPDRFLKEFETGQSTVADFLLAEVLDAQPAASQDLLLRASVCERTQPGLANALTGRDDAAAILAELQRANAFVEPLGHSWYRLHPLFAEILRAHLNTRHPGLERELHGRAARWLSDAGLLAEALPHAADAGDWEFAADRFVDDLAIGQLFTGLDADRLGALFSRMPPDTSGPAADLVRAACALARHDIDRGLQDLNRAEAHLPAAEARGTSAARLTCAFLRVLVGGMLGSAEMAETAARRAEELVEGDVLTERLEAHPEVSALMLAGLGSARLWSGRFDAAGSALSAAAEVSDGPSTAVPRQESLGRLALIDFLRGWPGRAEAHAGEAMAEAERSGLPPSVRTSVGQLVLAAVGIDHDDLTAARSHLHRAALSAADSRDPIVTSWLTIVHARLLLAGGEPDRALRVLVDMRQLPSAVTSSPWVNSQVVLARAAAYLAQGRPQAAVEVLARTADVPECAIASVRARLAAGEGEAARSLPDAVPGANGCGPAITVPALLVRAQAADALDDDSSAQYLVARALAAAGPEHLRRPFLEAGPWLRALLDRRPALWQAHGWLPARPATGARAVAPGDTASAPVIEPLSERECEVLGRLAQTMSTEEIAADLFLSVNTVKTHLKNIYRKLAVTRRGEAVRRGRELRLL